MGIPLFLSRVFNKYKRTTMEIKTTEVLLIDGNCIHHMALDNLDHKLNPSTEDFKAEIISTYKQYFKLFEFERCIICLDGMASASKKLCQRERREGTSNVLSMEMIPGTELSAIINSLLKENFSEDKFHLDDTSNAGEGEHKIIQYIVSENITRSIIITADSDLIVLALLKTEGCFVYYLSKKLSVDIDHLKVVFTKRGLLNSLLEIVVACGNDYLPKIIDRLTIEDVEKIFAFKKTKQDFNIDVFLTCLKVYGTRKRCQCSVDLIKQYFYQIKWFITCYIDLVSFNGIEYPKSLGAPCINCMLEHKDLFDQIELEKPSGQDDVAYAKEVLPVELDNFKLNFC